MAEASSAGAAAPPEEDEPEYESDPEEALLPSAMRRREASDDEEEVEGSDGEGKMTRAARRIGGIGSEEDFDGQGAAPGYEDEDSEREDYVEEVAEDDEELAEEEAGLRAGRAEIPAEGLEFAGEGNGFDGENQDYHEKGQGEGEEKKENEPFAVPTAGAFYMHDDRFRENGGGRHGRMKGGRKLWESKDERQWVHDRFEEMSIQDSRHKERNSRGRFRGRGGSRSTDRDRGYIRGNKPQSYDERPRAYDGRSRAYRDDRSRAYDEGGHQNHAPKSVRGRGSRRYEPLPKSNSDQLTTQNKQSGKSHDGASNNNVAKKNSSSSGIHVEQAHQQKHIFNSSLNSASPPFYPSGSSSGQDISASAKRDPNLQDNFSPSHSGPTFRGKTVVDPLVQDRYVVDDAARPVIGKTCVIYSCQLHLLQPSAQHRCHNVMQLPSVQRAAQAPAQSLHRASNQLSGQHSGGGSQVSSPSEVGESDSPRGSVKSMSTVSGKSKAITQGGGRGSFLYGGAQVMGASGAMGLAHGDQNFPGTPALLPVMQFGGQHPGVPTVGMALPGYVAQPQLGFGNSEMTWVPVLAGAAGGLGGSYAPYFALDGGYYACPPGQTSSAVSSSRETSAPKTAANNWKNPQRPEIVNDEFGQRQNKPRRYSEMNFGQ
ncbi:unnamed protein product [Spirodela intermedia]|uniref:Btz domain-containing protein n=1 Tax=Spirodela intermedia TaxID=51605 RepID=A0A7I8J861_SPIIN|nr:unnamed protein product [Spirodela intermedia]CAA6666279.1 unnamed protein product [Spirodela intermedia]